MRIERFEDIEEWQLAREQTRKVYDLTRKPKFAHDFGLRKQILRFHQILDNKRAR